MRQVLISLTLGLVLLTTACPLRSEPLTLTYSHLPPMGYRIKYGEPRGINVEFAQYILQKIDIDYDFKYLSFKDYMQKNLQGAIEFTIAPIYSVTPEHYFVSRTSPLKMTLKTYWLPSSRAIKKLESLRDQTVMKHVSYHFPDIIDESRKTALNLRFFNITSTAIALHLLQSGREKYLLEYDIILDSALAKLSEPPQLESFNIASLELYFAINKKVPGASAIMQQIDAMLELEETKSHLQSLIEQYTHQHESELSEEE